jgi:hypothetical protein
VSKEKDEVGMKLQRVDSVMPLCELFVETYGFQFSRDFPFANTKKVRTFVTDLESNLKTN